MAAQTLENIIPALEQLQLIDHTVSLSTVLFFIDAIRWLKPTIALCQPSHITTAPPELPFSSVSFFCGHLAQGLDDINLLWTHLRDIAWDLPASSAVPDQALINSLARHGLPHGLAPYNLLPPTRTCTNPFCTRKRKRHDHIRPQELVEPMQHDAMLFTKSRGSIPVSTTSLYCRNCNSRYYYNYYVHDDATTRTYYESAVPDIVQVAQHVFFERALLEHFSNLLVFAWTSAANAAKIYNLESDALASDDPARRPLRWDGISFDLDPRHIWDGLLLYWVLDEWCDRKIILRLRHDAATQAERLRPAMTQRNRIMAGTGQEQWSHACQLCTWSFVDPETGQRKVIRSTVTDGVTMGHTCCAVHDCKIALPSQKGVRFCTKHAHKEAECAFDDCANACESGFKTCAEPRHREIELEHDLLKQQSVFTLKARAARLEIAHDIPLDAEDDVLASAACADKPSTGNRRKPRVFFSRRRVHNEELCISSCGIILGRATFYGSEAPNGVLTFWLRLFPTLASMPHVLWHDNNCNIYTMLQNEPEEVRQRFINTIMPVDVFHFKCKHKETDTVCNEHCNPALFDDILMDGDKWRFNSSAAEQVNSWFVRFASVVREMEVVRYNFFLDEVVKRRNRARVAELERQGHAPYLIPRSSLL